MSNAPINLESLLDLSMKLIESNDTEYIFNAALLSLMGKLRVTKAAALVPVNGSLEILVSKGKVTRQSFRHISETRIFDCTEAHTEFLEEGFALGIPIVVKGEINGALMLADSMSSEKVSETERQYASLVALIAASALKSADHVRSLVREKSIVDSRNQLLESLFEMSTDLASLFTREQVLQVFSFRLMGQVMLSRFAVVAFEDNGGYSVPVNRLHLDFDTRIANELTRLDGSTRVVRAPLAPWLMEVLSESGVDLLIPLTVKKEMKGVLLVGKRMIGQFSDYDIKFMEALGTTLATSMENARLFDQEVEKKRIDAELSVARQIQHKLFPDKLPQFSAFDIAARNISSHQVGGDYFDVVTIDDDTVLLAIADVSGKGMPASILMANLQAALRVLSPLARELPDLVSRLNNVLYENTAVDKYVTFFVAEVDVARQTMRYTNAGHNPPLLFRSSGSVEELSVGGLVLGVLPDNRAYAEGEVELMPGDVVVLYTDGVNEAMNSRGECYGEERLISCVRRHQKVTAEQILGELLRDVEEFVAGAAQYDDVTLLILKTREQP